MISDHPATAELLAQAIRAVAAAKRPRDALAALLATARAWTQATGASLLWHEPAHPVPAASDGLADTFDPPDLSALPANSRHFPLVARDRLEGYLLLANVARPALVEAADFAALLDLAALALRDSRLNLEESPNGIVGVMPDISERRQLEQERLDRLLREQAARAEAETMARLVTAVAGNLDPTATLQIAGEVAHGLNQKLGLIAGHGDLALRALSEPSPNLAAMEASLNTVVQAAMDGVGTVRRLLALARPTLEGPVELVDLGELLDEVARLTAPRWQDAAQTAGRSIRLDVAAKDATRIEGWRGSLREALTNLVLNAVDALPDGGAIHLTARGRGDRVIVEVTDTGTGMSAEVQARVFEPFFTTKGDRGTGLGLAMVRGVVERHGGSIELESAPGRGTTFRLSFRASNVEAARENPSIDPPPVVPLRVLVVDDEPALGRMLAQLLQVDGHQVVVATSGEEALGLLSRSSAPFDLVVSDVGMGVGMNGWELARQTLAHYPSTCFALVTGWGVLIDADEAQASGIAAVLGKPYRLADLRRLVASVQARQSPRPTEPAEPCR
jgi:signal transduction histidine kinase/CheY-like chemotaxis protein